MPGSGIETTNSSAVSLTSTGMAPVKAISPARGRTKLSSSSVFIASRRVTMSRQGSQRLVLMPSSLLCQSRELALSTGEC